MARQEQITISVPEGLRGLTERVRRVADEDHRSLSSYIVILLHNHCFDKENPPVATDISVSGNDELLSSDST